MHRVLSPGVEYLLLGISDSDHQLLNEPVSGAQTALLARSTRTSAERINASRDEDLEESLGSIVSAKSCGDVFNTFNRSANATASAGTWVAPLHLPEDFGDLNSMKLERRSAVEALLWARPVQMVLSLGTMSFSRPCELTS